MRRDSGEPTRAAAHALREEAKELLRAILILSGQSAVAEEVGK